MVILSKFHAAAGTTGTDCGSSGSWPMAVPTLEKIGVTSPYKLNVQHNLPWWAMQPTAKKRNACVMLRALAHCSFVTSLPSGSAE